MTDNNTHWDTTHTPHSQDADGDTVERSAVAAGRELAIGGVGRGERGVGGDGHERVERRVVSRDARTGSSANTAPYDAYSFAAAASNSGLSGSPSRKLSSNSMYEGAPARTVSGSSWLRMALDRLSARPLAADDIMEAHPASDRLANTSSRALP